MKCFLILYKTKSKYETIRVNHALFGRIIRLNYKGKLLRYYYGGLLEAIPYSRLANGCYLIPFDECLVSDLVAIGGIRHYIVEMDNYNIAGLEFQTAEEKWTGVALRKGYDVKGLTRR